MCYANRRVRDLKFSICDKVFLYLSLIKDVMRFEKKGKFNPRFIDLFRILQHIRLIAYELAISLVILDVYLVFYVSILHSIF